MTTSKRLITVLVLVLVTLSGTIAVAGVGLAQTEATGTAQGEPDLDVHLPQYTVVPGEVARLNLQVTNDGEMRFGQPEMRDAVTAARNVRVEAEAEGPLSVETGQMGIGTVTTNRPGNASIGLTVPEGTEPGTYDIDVELAYSYTDIVWLGSTRISEKTETETRTVEVTVDEAPRFEIESVDTDVRVADRGRMNVTVANTGSQVAEDVRLTLESSSSKFLFGQSQAGTSRIASLEPDANATLSYDVAVQSEASVREYALSGTVQYTDPDGIPGVHRGLSAGVRPLTEQTFSVESAESTLRVGEEGELRGTITNTGPATVEDVVIEYADRTPTIVPVERSAAIGTLEPGDSAEFVLPLEVTTTGKATDRSLDMAVTYRNEDGEKRGYEDVNAEATVEERRDQFAVTLADSEIPAGSDQTIEATITNQLDEPVSNVNMKLFVDDPLDSDEDEGYIGSLDPGESATVTLQLGAAGSAIAKTYPADFDVKYEDSDGTSKISNTVTVPVTVTQPEDTGLPWELIGAAVLLVIIALGGYLYRRQ
ncbi:S-layer protein [Halanaeroarchaeum sp. HSR-CO]|uniref:COG1361 S-layer family protein n=1 Tax=Halanaeroarchaeum sp. HSR-CO TaxID=2866382 RepID=UPI00217DACA0|nr:COG1361 S-layer family protein [Halanaeroarchaeum sp. HSR-CO]UWG47863.1 S-layer protein [Halanaeroarchaeum sp. HSR-CO]